MKVNINYSIFSLDLLHGVNFRGLTELRVDVSFLNLEYSVISLS